MQVFALPRKERKKVFFNFSSPSYPTSAPRSPGDPGDPLQLQGCSTAIPASPRLGTAAPASPLPPTLRLPTWKSYLSGKEIGKDEGSG